MNGPTAPVPPRKVPAWAAVAVLTGLALWLRLHGVPGRWGSDGLCYVETVGSGLAPSTDPRAGRWLFLGVLRAALEAGAWKPAWASVPGALLSTAVVPVLWLAMRRPLGYLLALLPAALWAFLGSDIEEVVEVSADASLALPAALALWGLVAASRRERGAIVPVLLAGAAAGLGAVLKETMILAAAGLAVGALCTGRGRSRWTHAACFAAAAAAVFGAGLLLHDPTRLVLASRDVPVGSVPVSPGDPAFAARVTVAIPQLLLTAGQAYGLLFVVCLPLLARLPFRAARGDVAAAAALAGLLAFDLVPVSAKAFAVLSATFPRYFLCLMPALLAAVVAALAERPASRAERAASWLGAAAGVLFLAGGSAWSRVLVPPGLVLTVWPALPEAATRVLAERSRLAVAAAVLLAATVAWKDLATSPSTCDWAVAVGAAAVVTVPWVLGRDAAGPAPCLAIAAATLLATAMVSSRFVPDPGWGAWEHLPPAGRVFADRLVGRRLAVAARGVRADAARIELLGPDDPVPPDLGPADRILVRENTGLAQACRARADLVPEAVPLGEAVLFAPLPR